MHPEDFRRAAHELVDWIADHREGIAALPVAARTEPGAIAAALARPAPEEPEPFEAVLDDVRRHIVPGITQVQHPSYFGWFPSNASLASMLGDFTSTGLGALGITWQSAPALTEVEEVVTEWLRELTGLPVGWRGAIQDTASTGALVALLAARERASGFSEDRGGLQGERHPLIVYTSTQAHSSVLKAALLAGFGRDNVRQIEVDALTYAMRPEALAEAMASDVARGLVPAALVATLGTTGTTAFDPLGALAPIARAHGAWIHVDAAMAGSALILPEFAWMREGLELADSLTWNPHKWFGTILDCSLLYVREPEHLIRVMSTNPSYLQSAADGRVTQYKDWGIPLGRRFRSLKLWFQLRLDGAEAIRTRLRRDLAHAAWLAQQIRADPDWRVLAPVPLQTLCVRHVPTTSDGSPLGTAELDAHTLAWAARINDSGRAFVTPALLDGHWMVRISIGSEATERADVEALWRLLREEVTDHQDRLA